MGINYFMFNGKSSLDFEACISGEATFQSPERDIEIVTIPGKNGTLSLDNNRFKNVIIPYNAYIIDRFDQNYGALKAYLGSVKGYARLADTYHPDYYRMARFYSAIQPEMTQLNRHGTFVVNFDCDPRCFLKSGETFETVTNGAVLKNPTLYDALPLIRAYGTGTITIGGKSVQVTTANEYTDIDSEIQEAYKGSTNCNSNIVLTNGEFPKLGAGLNTITITGFTQVLIKPRWWTI